jgi:hypothetical protein
MSNLSNLLSVDAYPLGAVASFRSAPTDGKWLPTGTTISRASYPALSAAFPDPLLGGPGNASAASAWTLRTNPGAAPCSFGNGVFIAMSATNTKTSTDCITWATGVLPSGTWYYYPAYGGGIWLLCNGSTASRSTDGLNWTAPLATGVNFNPQMGFYANGLFVFPSWTRGDIATTTDGITWVMRAMPRLTNWTCGTYGNGKFVVVSRQDNGTSLSYVATSTDGITWVHSAEISGLYGGSVAYGNGMFVYIGGGSGFAYDKVATSTDAITWTIRTLPASGVWYTFNLTFSNGLFIGASASNNNVVVSTNGITWGLRSVGPSNNGSTTVVGGGTISAIYASYGLYTSSTSDPALATLGTATPNEYMRVK